MRAQAYQQAKDQSEIEMKEPRDKTEKYTFQAEVNRMTNSLYCSKMR